MARPPERKATLPPYIRGETLLGGFEPNDGRSASRWRAIRQYPLVERRLRMPVRRRALRLCSARQCGLVKTYPIRENFRSDMEPSRQFRVNNALKIFSHEGLQGRQSARHRSLKEVSRS